MNAIIGSHVVLDNRPYHYNYSADPEIKGSPPAGDPRYHRGHRTPDSWGQERNMRSITAALSAAVIVSVVSSASAADRRITGFGPFKFGMSRADIIALLGPPAAQGADSNDEGVWILSYNDFKHQPVKLGWGKFQVTVSLFKEHAFSFILGSPDALQYFHEFEKGSNPPKSDIKYWKFNCLRALGNGVDGLADFLWKTGQITNRTPNGERIVLGIHLVG